MYGTLSALKDFRCVWSPSHESISWIRLLQCKCLWGLGCIIDFLLMCPMQIFSLSGSWELQRLLSRWQVVSAAFHLFRESPLSCFPCTPKWDREKCYGRLGTWHVLMLWGAYALQIMSSSLYSLAQRVKSMVKRNLLQRSSTLTAWGTLGCTRQLLCFCQVP